MNCFKNLARKVAICGTIGFVAFVFWGCSEESSTSASQEQNPISSSIPASTNNEQGSSSVKTPESSASSQSVVYGEMTDERDGHTYKTVVIGSQTWMAENLNYADSVKSPVLAGSNWCFGNSKARCDEYGRLYSWAAAIDSVTMVAERSENCGLGVNCKWLRDSVFVQESIQGICPKGWHLPSVTEWKKLIAMAGSKALAGENLKSDIDWNGSNSIGFSALPAGCFKNSFFEAEGTDAFFWSINESDVLSAFRMTLNSGVNGVNLYSDNKGFGFSVRCLKD